MTNNGRKKWNGQWNGMEWNGMEWNILTNGMEKDQDGRRSPPRPSVRVQREDVAAVCGAYDPERAA